MGRYIPRLDRKSSELFFINLDRLVTCTDCGYEQTYENMMDAPMDIVERTDNGIVQNPIRHCLKCKSKNIVADNGESIPYFA